MISFLAGGRLDAPFYPTKTHDKFIGRQVELIGAGEVSDSFSLPYDVELVTLYIKAETFYAGDYWGLVVGGDKIAETVYTVNWEEGLPLLVAHPVKAGEVFKFTFHGMGSNLLNVTYHILK